MPSRSLFCELRPEGPLRDPSNGLVLGDTVRQARCAKGWSIPQLSKRSGVPGRLIREMEGGSPTYVPSEANTVLLAEALRVPVGPLLEEREQLFEHLARRDVVK
jgi:transcriptional regulator with XRE-family HTH domain